ncbi:hypothetical protein V7S43_018091 [Phytophthora oleae]|uniref:NAD(P)-binding domain-containing protein n=1 Tax=Phytophthora oleae TaxID=2107226 RepID=A0ABD3ERG0_9STRA
MGRRIQAKNVCDAARAVGVKRVCYTSFVGAGCETDVEKEIPFLPRDHHFVEKIVKESGLDYNIQRNWLYMDNIPTLFAPSWKFCGDKWLSNSHGTPGAYVAREDCGRVLAAIFTGPWRAQQGVRRDRPQGRDAAGGFRLDVPGDGLQG